MKKLTFKKTNIIFINFIILINFIIVLPTAVSAQTTSLSIWPPLTEVMLQPGKEATQEYELTNNSAFQLMITPQIFPFDPQGEKGQIKIYYPQAQMAGKKEPILFSFSQEDKKLNEPFVIKPNQTIKLDLKIGLPRRSPPKDYYYTLFFATAAKDQTGQNQTSSVTQIGTNIVITSSQSGEPVYSGRIVQFSAPKIIDSFSPVNFIVRLENTGDNFFKPFGQIKIEGPLNQKGEIKLLEQNILAYSIRQLEIPSFKPKLAIGPFKAKLTFTINETGSEFSAAAGFFYFPFKLVGGIIMFLVILGIVRKIKKVNLKTTIFIDSRSSTSVSSVHCLE